MAKKNKNNWLKWLVGGFVAILGLAAIKKRGQQNSVSTAASITSAPTTNKDVLLGLGANLLGAVGRLKFGKKKSSTQANAITAQSGGSTSSVGLA